MSIFGLMKSIVPLSVSDTRNSLINFSLKGKESLNDRHIRQHSCSYLDVMGLSVSHSDTGTDEATAPQEKEKRSIASAHVQRTSPQRSEEAGADGGDVVFRQDWVSV